MTLGSPDSNGLGRYTNTTSIGGSWRDLLNLALASVSARFTAFLLGDSGWLTPTLTQGWVSSSIRYRKLNGVVYLRGRLSGSAATGNTAFTLPVGYRPEVDRDMLALTSQTVGVTAVQLVQVLSSGAVVADRTLGNIRSLDMISFPAA